MPEGLADRIAYTIDDFDRVRLPRRRYDIVFCHQSLHHVSRLERLLREGAREEALTPARVSAD